MLSKANGIECGKALPPAGWRRKTVRVLVRAFIFAFVFACIFVPAWSFHLKECGFVQTAYAASGESQQLSAIEYAGDEVKFCQADLTSSFGMYGNDVGDMAIQVKNGKVHVSFTPNNQSVYRGFYLGVGITDVPEGATYPVKGFKNVPWIGAKGKVRRFTYDFELDVSYCGYAWPIAPIKMPDRGGGTTAGQYYLAIPSAQKAANYVATRTVTFEDGLGNVISEQKVKMGQAATPPDDPTREGYTFDGWDPATFNKVTQDLTVEAQWLSDDEVAANAVRKAIDELPDDPTTLLRDTGNEKVAAAVSAYNALPANVQKKLSGDDRLKLVKCAIAVLPSDPFAVTSDHGTAIAAARSALDSLPKTLRAKLESEAAPGGTGGSGALRTPMPATWKARRGRSIRCGRSTTPRSLLRANIPGRSI